MANVLFVCTQNAGRSQMSEAFFNRITAGEHAGRSAGTDPADRVHPVVVDAMREVGIDLEGRRPQRLSNALAGWADLIVTMGCGDQCPVIPGKRYLEWELDDPAGMPLTRVRQLRDDVRNRVEALARELDR